LVDTRASGALTGRAELTLRLVSVKAGGRVVDINTQSVSQQSDSRGQQSAKVAGGGAALGAVLGTAAGGGKGAVIGGVTGGAVGTGAAAVLKGERVKVPPETRLTFVLDTAVKI
jgi:outer membrane lipoprotein SlyB